MKIILREYAVPIDPADPPIGPGVTPLSPRWSGTPWRRPPAR